ncbi:30S ribosomal protein S7 [bacterium (candidate division B38) B3_B38]|nr:MAG: 30S ribosomal protein S7 [bacterium (candidate division B38) B3_B38]
MPRRKTVIPREVEPDPVYHSTLVSRFINSLMKKGEKSLAQRILYDAMKIIEQRTKDDPMKILQQAYENVKPVLEVKARRVGGSTYQVPVEVRTRRRSSLSIRWILTYTRKRKDRTMQERLAAELLDAARDRGEAIKKREDTHRMAEANKAFAHYRW